MEKVNIIDQEWREKWKDKEITAEDAIKKIFPGNRVFIDSGCSKPQALTSELIKQSESLIDTEIYDQKLHLTCYFRSWDAYAGLPSNISGIQLFNEALVAELNRKGDLSLKTGKLIFHSKNCHIYMRQYKLVEELLEPKHNKKPALTEIIRNSQKNMHIHQILTSISY